ncbi:MAG: hypothetical protein J7K72_05020 [Candidatus Aenigmarchaeota archaeon]|nr:hypothetical protein [Candidatus Aenigmarchaeota archaeon]
MKSKHSYVVLIDLPEVLPFEMKRKKGIKEILEMGEEDIKKVFEFVVLLEKEFGEEISFIGEDVIAEKFYRRFLFPNGGFMEIMTEPPAAIVAHFIEIRRARKFAEALKRVLNKVVKEKTIRDILKKSVEVSSEKEDVLTYKKWTEMKSIREMIGD